MKETLPMKVAIEAFFNKSNHPGTLLLFKLHQSYKISEVAFSIVLYQPIILFSDLAVPSETKSPYSNLM